MTATITTGDFVEEVLHQMELECPFKIYFCLWKNKKVPGLFWRSIAV